MHKNIKSISWNELEGNGELTSPLRNELQVARGWEWGVKRFLGEY